MSAPAAGAKQGIPLNELGVEQLSALQKQVEQELAFFQESSNQLKIFLKKNENSIAALTTMVASEKGDEALIPLSESMYVRAELSDPTQMLVEIGTGYFAEMTSSKAIDFFERKKKYISTQIIAVDNIVSDKKRTRNIIADNLQSKVEAQIAQLSRPSATAK